ncbi:MAG: Crp/Fnr family transcriptional regulator [Rhodobacteraceae bacterium]|jgi:CRP-like cAMP-binding protein|nr:Crp/Fnr family transcriptional regulator [Paracoccaceae bacterium]
MQKAEAISVMGEVGWLSRQPSGFREEVLRRCHLSDFGAGDVLYGAGDPCGGVYGLVDGLLRVSVARDRPGAIWTRGAWFGEGAALRRGPRLVTVTAMTPATVLVLPLAEFERLIANADHCRRFACLTVDHAEEAIGAAADLLLRDSVARVSARLVGIQRAQDRGDGDLTLTQSDLGLLCGLTRATVSRVLTRLSAEGAIALSYGRITVLDRSALLRHADRAED